MLSIIIIIYWSRFYLWLISGQSVTPGRSPTTHRPRHGSHFYRDMTTCLSIGRLSLVRDHECFKSLYCHVSFIKMLPYKKVWSSHFISFSFSTQHQTIRLELRWAGLAASVLMLMYQVSSPILSHLQITSH